MPIDLFKNIIMPHIASRSGIRMVEPAGNLKEYIENFYIFPYRYNLKSYLAFNDGFPMAAIMVGEEGIHNLNDYKYGISSAWFSAKINGNRRIYISKKFSYLLIIRFKKIPFYRLFGLNPKKFNNRPFWSFSDILGDDGTELLKIISLCSTEKEKIRAIESFIEKSKPTPQCPIKLLETADEHIYKQKGITSIKNVTEQLNLSYKWLDRSFARHIGIRPKEYASLQRFIHAYFAFMENKNYDLMDIAVNSSYYDQNHFTKEFKKYTGLSPLIYRHSLFCRKQNYF